MLPSHPVSPRRLLLLGLSLACLLGLPVLPAQAPATGTVAGRVLNPASGEYVRNAEVRIAGTNLQAETGDGGFYSIANVPAGTVTVEVSYTGYAAPAAVLKVAAGLTATHDFNLQSTAGGPVKEGDVIKLEAFTVAAEREGNAKAIMDQRRNMNVSTSVASDIFGDVTDGNVGEFLKFLPGVDVDYVESETRGPRLGGMDAQYVGVSFDGIKLASADANRTGDLGRATSFEAFAISSIESIEINRTTSPDMDADSPAGTINMKTRRAFDRKGRRIGYNFSLNANSEEFTWSKTWGPDDRKNLKLRPNYTLEYSDVFLGGRLGLVASVSHANSYTEQYREDVRYHRSPSTADPRPMVVTSILFKDGPKFILKDTYTLTADFKATPRLVLSATMIYNFADGLSYNRELTFTAAQNNSNVNNGRTHSLGSLLEVRTDGLAANNSRTVGTGGSFFSKVTSTITLAPKFEYKWRSWTAEGATTYSRSFNNYDSIERGIVRLPGMNSLTADWVATRPDITSSHWTFRQTSGPDWFSLSNYANPNITNSGQNALTEIYNSELSARWVTPLKRFPLTLKFGGKWNEENRKNGNDQAYQVWRYTGPGGNILTGYNAQGFPTFTTAGSWDFAPSQMVFDTGTMDLLRVYNAAGMPGMVPRGDANTIADLFKAHPEYFVNSGSIDNYYNAYVANKRDIRQTISAGYGMADLRLTSKLQVRTGLRWERTESASREFDPLTAAQVLAAGYPISTSNRRATTIAGINYQYFSQPRLTRTKAYANYFPSVSAKYSFSRNLQLQAGYNKSISRPPIDDLNGVWAINDTTFVVTAPNAALLPEYSEKYVARLAYYYEPAGELSLTVTQNEVTNLRQDITVSADDFGYGDDPEYGGYTFNTTVNTVGLRRFRSAELAYRQTLSFLPNPFRGTTVNLGYTRGYSNARRSNLAPHRATANLGYSYRKLNARFGVVWHDNIPWDSIYGRFKRHSTQYDLSGGYQLTKKASLFFQGRNIFNRPVRWFESPSIEGEAGALWRLENYGANWVFGIKGTF